MYNIEVLQEKIRALFRTDKYQEAYDFCTSEINRITQRVDDVDNLSDEETKYLAEIYSIIARITPPQDALKNLNSAINLVGNCAEYYIQRGRVKEELGDLQEAFDDYSIAIANEPRFEAYGYRGSIYLDAGNIEAAIEDFTKSVELNPNYGGGYINRGRAKYSLNDFEGAIKDYDIAIEQYPDYAYTYGCRADAKIKLNNLEGAIADFRKILELEPENITAKQAILDLKIQLSEEDSIKTIAFTKKNGTKVQQFITDEGIIELPFESRNSENNSVYVEEKATTPITKTESPKVQKNKAESLDFNSPTISEDLKKYLINNVNFPKNDILQFSFSYNKTGIIANIHLTSISGEDYHDGNEYYASRVYGDSCKRDGLGENQVLAMENSIKPDLKACPASATVDGKYLLKIYEIIKNIGNYHITEVPYEKEAEFSTIGGMYYKGSWYIDQ